MGVFESFERAGGGGTWNRELISWAMSSLSLLPSSIRTCGMEVVAAFRRWQVRGNLWDLSS